MTKSTRLVSTTILVLAWLGSALAQDRSPFAKTYEDVRFKIWYMHWRRGSPPIAPYRHDGSVIMVFLGDGTLQLPSGAKQNRHDGEVASFEPGSVATAGELVTDRPLRAVVIELKEVRASNPLQPSSFPPALPRSDATKVIETAKAIVWDSVIRPDQPSPLRLHDKASVRVWITGAVFNRAHPNEAPGQETKAAGDWEMAHAGNVDSEQVVGAPAHVVTVQLK
jgi:hypothetical protein